MKQLLVLAAAALLATGCALSPQQIQIEPKPQVTPANFGQNSQVQVIAVDSRSQKAFGSRGGVYKDTALVMPANDVREAIEEAVRGGLQSLGYNAFNPGGDATTLEVRLEKLDYVPEEGSVVNRVNLDLVLQAEARRGDTTHTGTYKSSTQHDLPFTPNVERNQAMVNEILSRSIERLLNDREMLDFLAGDDSPLPSP
ncbi:MAG: YajG family lipoprotein [Alcanivorax sp.]|nr:YajG family lipoprotein [Alcanivorax sp.]